MNKRVKPTNPSQILRKQTQTNPIRKTPDTVGLPIVRETVKIHEVLGLQSPLSR